MSYFCIENLTFKYGDNIILDDVSLEVKKGEIVVIMGLSGSGKTTLIKLLSGVIPHREKGNILGTLLLDKRNIQDMSFEEISAKVSTVYQNPDDQILFSRVMSELAFAPENFCMTKQEIIKRINDIARYYDIANLLDKNPNNLSGGEKQVVVLASILVMDTHAVLLDEVMSQVDAKGKELIKKSIKKLKEMDKAVVMIDHDVNNIDIADRILVIKDGKLKPYDGELV